MHKKKINPVFDKFEVAIASDRSKAICKVNKCGKEFKGTVVGNLKRYILLCHPKDVGNNDERNFPESSAKAQQTKQKIKIKMDASTINRAWIKLVTVDSMPFRILDSEGFREIVNPIYDLLGVVINVHYVTKKNDEISTIIRQKISAELKNWIFCLKVDGKTCSGRSVLGINAQFLENLKIEIEKILQTWHKYYAARRRMERTW